MSQAKVGPDAPVLVVVRTATSPSERTLEAIEAGRRRGDRVVVAHPRGAAAPVDRPVARRLGAIAMTDDEAFTAMSEHAGTTGGPVVLVHNGAHGFGKRWLDDLTGALRTATAGAVLAATNGAPWPACPDGLPASDATRSAWREYALALRDRPVVDVDEPAAMDGPVVALSAAAVDALGRVPARPPLEVAEMTRAVAASALGVRRASGVYVHDDHTDVVLSACLIMKDEIDNLARCINSVRGVVDEIVIYDTGSTDGSIELARALGAVVIEGTWDDDFSRARNEARRACRGTWLLHLDADEELEDPPAARDVRAVLQNDLPIDVYAVPLHNLSGTELAPIRNPTPFWVPRLLHRTRCHWTGALHEHPTPVSGRGDPRVGRVEQVRIVHYGYLDEAVARHKKWDRNTRIATTKLDDVNDAGRTHFERGRTLALTGKYEDAVEEYTLAFETGTNPVQLRSALELGAQALITLGRLDEADRWIARRAALPHAPGVARWLRALAALRRSDHAAAYAELDGIADVHDNYSTIGDDAVHVMRADALVGLERHTEAGSELVAALRLNPASDEAWLRILRRSEQWPEVLHDAAHLVPDAQLKLLSAKLLHVPAPLAAAAAEALWGAHPGSRTVLALAITLGTQLDIDTAMRWSARLRDAGLVAHCPLRAIARDVVLDPQRRVQAAFAGVEHFGDTELAEMVDELAALFSLDV